MGKEELDAFFDALRQDHKLAEAFASATGGVARDNGYDVDDEDVFNRFNGENDEPDTRLPPPVRRSTMAMGEEGGRATTAAIGEEGTRPRASSKAMGEEGGPRFR